MKVGIYLQSATGDTTQIVEQELQCRAHARADGWEVSAAWSDSSSGLRMKRPGLQTPSYAMAERRVKGKCEDRVVSDADEKGVTVIPVDSAPDLPLRSVLTAQATIHSVLERRGRNVMKPGQNVVLDEIDGNHPQQAYQLYPSTVRRAVLVLHPLAIEGTQEVKRR